MVFPPCELALRPRWRLWTQPYHRAIEPEPDPVPPQALRGAAVAVEPRRVARALLVGLAGGLALTAALLLVGGLRQDHRVDLMRSRAVPVAAQVSSCLGLLGGSGSNGAGYSCQARYRLAGRTHSVTLPGTRLYGSGQHLRLLVVPSDPGLVALAAGPGPTRSSPWRFALAAVLAAAGALVGVVLARSNRRDGRLRRSSQFRRRPPPRRGGV